MGRTRKERSDKKSALCAKTNRLRLALEPRILYDAAGLAAGLDIISDGDSNSVDHIHDINDSVHTVDSGHSLDSISDFVPPAITDTDEIVFIDSNVRDYQEVIDDIPQDARIIVLDPDQDEIEQITNALSQYNDLDAVHIISHGTEGQVVMSSGKLSMDNVASYSEQLSQWKQSLSADADILIYGCDVAGSEQGADLLSVISGLTGADVAASSDATGAEGLSGDWDLEVSTGNIEAGPIVVTGYQDVLGVPSVSNLSNTSYTEGDSAVVIDSDVSFSGGTSYSGGYVEFELTNGQAEDDLGLVYDSAASTTNGALTIVDGTVYLGNGTDAAVVGSVDATYNGQDGQKLRINFSNEFENGDFSDGSAGSTTITGWTAVNAQVKFGTDTIAGLPTPTDTVWPTNGPVGNHTDQNTPSTLGTLQTVLSSTQNDGSGYSVQMSSSGMQTLVGFDIVRGPYIYSNGTVALSSGDTVSFEWQAQGGGDAYDVYGYIVDVNTGHIETILNETGGSTAASTTWATETISVSTAGQYKFVFVSGTYDYSGGRAAGAQLYIDDVTVTQAVVPATVNDSHVTQIARRVTYENTSEDPDTTTRNFQITALSGTDDTGTTSSNISITAVDDAPVITATGGNSIWTEDGSAIAVDSGLTITDVDGGNITNATVTINNVISGDTLSFADQNGINGSYDGTTGVLTLSGSASVANYQTALRSVTFSSSVDEADTTSRDISFSIGSAISNPDNDHYFEYISGSYTWTQARDAAAARTLYGLQGYLATVTSLAENTYIEEKLQADAWIGAADTGIEGTWQWVTGPEIGTTFYTDPDSGGNGDVTWSYWNPGEPNDSGGNEDYAEIYSTQSGHWNDLPNSSQLGYVVEYGGMAGDPTLQLSASKTVTIQAVNDAPTLTGLTAKTVDENAAASLIDTDVTFSDDDIGDLDGGTVTVSGLDSEDTVSLLTGVSHASGVIQRDGNNIQVSDGSTWTTIGTVGTGAGQTGVGETLLITLNNNAAVSNVDALLQALTFYNNDDTPTASRTLSITVTDGDSGTTGAQTVSVSVIAVEDAPVLTTSGDASEWTEDGSAIVIDSALTIADPDGGNIESTKVTINNVIAGDTLSFVDQNGITGSYDSTTGVLSLSGSASVANYQAALRSVTFSSSIDEPDTTARDITFTIGSALSNPDNGHFYEYISGSYTWTQARDAAAASTLYGLQGYLATVTSLTENTYIEEKLQADAWIGGADTGIEGTWVWMTGPEAGTTFYTDPDSGGSGTVTYSNWNSGEPNDSSSAEDYAEIYSTNNGLWNDLGSSNTLGYVVEYGGMAGDPALQLSAVKTVNIQPANDAPTLTGLTVKTINENTVENIDTNVTFFDEDTGDLDGGTITVSGLDSHDEISMANGVSHSAGAFQRDGNNIQVSDGSTWTTIGTIGTGAGETGAGETLVITLNSNSTVSNVDALLQNLTFYNSSDNPTASRTLSISVTDGDGGTTGAQTVTVTVAPVNDAPVITTPGAINITDTGSADIFGDVTGTITASDVDAGTTLSYGISGGVVTGGNSALTGTYGTLTINTSTGSYVFAPDNNAINALSADTNEIFTVTVGDGEATVTEHLTVAIQAEAETQASYTEQGTAVNPLSNVTITTESGTSYAGGYIDFEVSGSESSETLGFSRSSSASVASGVVTIVGNAVYLGDGTGAKVIGSVDSYYNGANGQKLRVKFTTEFDNGNFEVGSAGDITVTGWTMVNERVTFCQDQIAGQDTPIDTTYPTQNLNKHYNDYGVLEFPDGIMDIGNVDYGTYTSSVVSGSVANGGTGNAIKMRSSLNSADGYEVIRGPYIYSNGTVALEAGDTVSFYWKAEGGSDAYDVYGYVVDVNTGATQTILDDTGANARAITAWAQESITINTAGEYRFVFVSGSFDATGGEAMGAQLYIDDVEVTQANPPDSVTGSALQQIARLVTYENSSDLTANNATVNRAITVTAVQAGDTTDSSVRGVQITEVNDAPVLQTPGTVYYTDTDGSDSFSNAAGNLIASDVDSGSTLTYSITGSTDNGNGTESVTGDYGVLTVNKTTGAYEYNPDDAAINALTSNVTETFTVNVTDGDAVDCKTFTVEISSVNDAPLLGGAASTVNFIENGSAVLVDPTITISDLEGTSYDSGHLTFSTVSYGESDDNFVILNMGGITVSGSNVSYGGTVIGTVDGTYNGANGADLRINLNSNAFSPQVEALARAVAFKNPTDDLSDASRTVTIQVNDGGNGGSTAARYSTKSATVQVTEINDIPVVDMGTSILSTEKVLVTNPDGDFVVTGLSVSDADHSSLTLVFSTSDTGSGRYADLTFDTTIAGGITAGQITGNGTGVVTVTASIDAINTTLSNSNGLTYSAASGNDFVAPGPDTLTITATDAESGSSFSSKQVVVMPAVPNADSDNIVSTEEEVIFFDIGSLVTDINDNSGTYLFGTGTPDDADGNGGSLTPFSGNEIYSEFDLNGDSNSVNDVIGYRLAHGEIRLTDANKYIGAGQDFAEFTYTPDADWSGVETFLYQYTSGSAQTSDIAQIAIYVAPTNDAPVITVGSSSSTIAEDASLVFTSGGTNSITLADVDFSGTELLDLTLGVDNGSIALGSTTGLIFLSGADSTGSIVIRGTLTDLSAAVEGLVYTPNSDYNGSDTLSISLNDRGNTGSGGALSVSQAVAITVNPVDDAPEVSSVIPDVNLNEDSDTITIDLANVFTDLDNDDTLISKTILSNSNPGLADISLSGNTLTIDLNENMNGSATIVIRGASNGQIIDTSFTLNVNPVNDAPVITTTAGALNYTENDGPVVIDSTITPGELDDVNLESATVRITGNYIQGEDILGFTDTGTITGSFDASTGILILTGSDTVANYTSALRSITYENTSDDPDGSSRSITYSVNDGDLESVSIVKTVNINPVNDIPVIATTAGAINYTENDGPVVIDSTITPGELDDVNLESATVRITGNYVQGEDILGFTDTGTITGSFDASTGILTLTGSDTVANYTSALRSITYENTSDDPDGSARTITYSVNDGNLESVCIVKTVNIGPVNDFPVVANGLSNITVNEDAVNTVIDVSNVFDDIDDSNNLIAKTVYSNSNESLVSANISGNILTLDYQKDQIGTSMIVIRGTSNGQTVDESFTVTVNSINDIPSANSFSLVVDEDTPITIDSWQFSDPLELVSDTPDYLTILNIDNLNGTLKLGDEILESGSTVAWQDKNDIIFLGDFDYYGAASFTYNVTDRADINPGLPGTSEISTVTINVRPVEDPVQGEENDVSEDTETQDESPFSDNAMGTDLITQPGSDSGEDSSSSGTDLVIGTESEYDTGTDTGFDDSDFDSLDSLDQLSFEQDTDSSDGVFDQSDISGDDGGSGTEDSSGLSDTVTDSGDSTFETSEPPVDRGSDEAQDSTEPVFQADEGDSGTDTDDSSDLSDSAVESGDDTPEPAETTEDGESDFSRGETRAVLEGEEGEDSSEDSGTSERSESETPVKESSGMDVSGGSPIVVDAGISDVHVVEGETASLIIPDDAFLYDGDDTDILYQATLTDGSELPDWIEFDSNTGRFVINYSGQDLETVDLSVTAIDKHGNSATTIFRIIIDEKDKVKAQEGLEPVPENDNPENEGEAADDQEVSSISDELGGSILGMALAGSLAVRKGMRDNKGPAKDINGFSGQIIRTGAKFENECRNLIDRL